MTNYEFHFSGKKPFAKATLENGKLTTSGFDSWEESAVSALLSETIKNQTNIVDLCFTSQNEWALCQIAKENGLDIIRCRTVYIKRT